MKEYAFQFRGKTHHLKGLTDEVKQAVVDRIVAKEYARLRRLLDAKLIEPEQYAELKDDARATPFLSRVVQGYLETEEGAKVFLRAMVVGGDDWPEDAIDELGNASPDSSAALALEQARADAFPKPMTLPVSTESGGVTSGEGSCSASHSS